jgi:hypothetical protein
VSTPIDQLERLVAAQDLRIAAQDLRIAALEVQVSHLSANRPAPAAAAAIADDADLDSQYGDERVRKDPTAKYWAGVSHVGLQLSQCPPDYLDAFAKYKEACAFMNEKEGDPAKAKYAGYDRRDAARARGWAKRLRAGWKRATPAMAPAASADTYAIGIGDDGDDDRIPF